MFKKIFEFFKNNKIDVFLVGGAVRDLLQGKHPKDYDFVAFSTPERLISLGGKFTDSKTCIPVFLFNIDGIQVEVALPRKEIKTGKGYKGFSFSVEEVSLIDDLSRRDFTINAIAMDSNGNIIDPFNGVNDLKNKILRAVNPQAFADDPLRVIRLCRFSSKGFSPTEETLNLARKVSREEFEALPVERFINELIKALHEPYSSEFFKCLINIPTACSVFFPELLQSKEIPAGPAQYHPEGSLFNHIVSTISKCSSPISKFMALFHDIGKLLTPKELLPHHYNHDSPKAVKFAEEICKRLRVPSTYVKAAKLAVRLHMKAQKISRKGKLILLAEEIVKSGFEKEFVDLIIADGCSAEQVEKLSRAINIAKIPVRELVEPSQLKDKNPDQIKSIILNTKVAIFDGRFAFNSPTKIS